MHAHDAHMRFSAAGVFMSNEIKDPLHSLCTCAAVRQVSRHMTQFYDTCLAPFGLTVSQFSILSRLHRSGPRTINGRLHYAWITAAVVFMVLLVAAAVRSTPGVLMVPLENAFGWSRSTISSAVALNLALYGLLGPFAGAAMQRFGIKRTVLCA